MDGLMSNLGSAAVSALRSAVLSELLLAWGVDGDIRTLQRRTETIKAVLRDAERRAIDEEALRKWLTDLKDVAFDAEDVLDELQTEAALREGKEKVPCCLCPYLSNLLPRNRMAHKIKDIVKRFEEVAEDREKFLLAEGATVATQGEREEFSFQVEDAEIFGRDDDKAKVVEWLTQVDDDDRALSVLPIVGLGGLGKTTLARLVYNDGRTSKHFENRIWVCVGEDLDLKAVCKAILEGVPEAQSVSTLEGLHGLIRERVTNKRYLLILDDLWCEDRSKLERLQDMLRGSAHGSKIVVTTRSHTVATIMGTAESAHKLKGLADDDCWRLFKRRAFGPWRGEESPNLVKIGKEIVRRCGGLPLAAKSLGGLMATKHGEGEWLAIENSEIWNLDGCAEGILPALQLSYKHLSPQLKQCFTYCSVFPKDYEIKKVRLIQLWIAQGFIQSNRGMNLEDIGTRHFNTLLSMSFLQDEEKDVFGNIASCKMHDLVHDLACFVAKDESTTVKVDGKMSFPQGCRYSSLIYHAGSSSSIVEIASEANKLRSFFLLPEDGYGYMEGYADIDDPKFLKEISNLTRLRALHLQCTSKGNIVRVLRELKHLRFIELSGLKVEALPDSITDLRNMQTLNLGICEELKELPKSLMMMSNLRHLVVKGCYRLTGMPRGIGKLTKLQTLSLFYVGREERHASIAELGHLNQIKGELDIEGLGNVKDAKDAMEASLSFKSGLLSLELNWGHDREGSESSNDVLENLQPHLNLKDLSIRNYRGRRFPNWFTNLPSSLPNLVKLNMWNIPNCETLPPLGLLPSLKELRLDGMHGLEKVGEELCVESSSASVGHSFPSLKRLYLMRAEKLEEWSVPGRGAFPSLESLYIGSCPGLKIVGSRISVSEREGRELDEQNQHPPSFMSLSLLSITDCPSLAALPEWLCGIGTLKDLIIRGCTDLQMVPDGIQHLSGLNELVKLVLDNIPNCETLPQLGLLPSLKELGLYQMHGLEKVGEELYGESSSASAAPSFPSLKSMYLAGADKLEEWSVPKRGAFPSLEELIIGKCPVLKTLGSRIRLSELEGRELDEQNQHPPSCTPLSRLEILGCPSFAALPQCLSGFVTLQSLIIRDCPDLQMLPDWIQRLPRLKRLHIYKCPRLKGSCERETGEDWHIISHITD